MGCIVLSACCETVFVGLVVVLQLVVEAFPTLTSVQCVFSYVLGFGPLLVVVIAPIEGTPAGVDGSIIL